MFHLIRNFENFLSIHVAPRVKGRLVVNLQLDLERALLLFDKFELVAVSTPEAEFKVKCSKLSQLPYVEFRRDCRLLQGLEILNISDGPSKLCFCFLHVGSDVKDRSGLSFDQG